MERAEFGVWLAGSWLTGVDLGALQDRRPPAPSSMEAFL